ncbi:MAG TPA: PQQ-binding-like beta-propeller repeat protein, partial [Candidatus Krumholzibacteria bacterium]|nr:PQQ-binding-like beta-propeller repeat protein [Candidatus Krumholzibacteria bacterium]
DTRVDDLRGLGIYLVVEETEALYLLCARDAHARVRVGGVFVPLHETTQDRCSIRGEEMDIETTRAQHDLFAQTLPDALVLYRIPRPQDGTELALLLGGSPGDLAAALDALDARPAGAASLESDRIARSLVCLRFDARRATRDDGDVRVARRSPGAWTRGAVAALLVVGGAVGVGLVATRVDFERPPLAHNDADAERTARATQERPTPVMTRDASVSEATAEVAAVDERAREEADHPRFALAWEKSYSEPVTSSPSLLGDGVVFGSRDGRVYAVDRGNGKQMWSHAAVGGVGASPLVRGDAVVVADYGGNVYRLARGDGRTLWKRALKERIVSTPAATGERVAVGTSRGNVYALSFETGRVLWKFAARGQVRGGIAHAGGTFFVPSHDGRLYALADDTGRKRWSLALGGPVASTPFTDGTRVVVGTAQGSVVALAHADGKRLWSFATRGPVNSAVLIHDGRVYAGSADEHVYCLDAGTGKLIWSFETSGTVLSRPFVDGKRVVVTSYDGSVYALDASDGTLVDRYPTEQSIFSSPVVDGDRVYFGNNAGRFFCLNLQDS